ncbi:heavy metal-associated domain-containing protein [Arthrobacter sp. Br18]|uniref:heavy-metal-associated domain-containing protein n=1 Tax=Arthrobacter sp. Br18 TaxID=1312954 RepID=UPI0004B98A21|nr:heavy metal-associated domain-containing protein [Arthrobacter sp. Br18]
MCSTSVTTRPLTETGPSGCACCVPRDEAPATNQVREGEVPADFSVTGLTCGSCASRVTDTLGELDGVRDVRIALVPGGVSTVSVISTQAIPSTVIATAVEQAGYQLLMS